ncbi:MAG: hypothetical protein ACOCP8_09225 [archaeon]
MFIGNIVKVISEYNNSIIIDRKIKEPLLNNIDNRKTNIFNKRYFKNFSKKL